MKLIEFDGKRLLAGYGLHMLPARLIEADSVESSLDGQGDVVLKAQILEGKRGKSGLIRRVDRSSAGSAIAEIRAKLVERSFEPLLMIEQAVDIVAEYYLAVRIDDVRQQPVIMFSTHGGIDVEDNPESILTYPVDALRGLYPHDVLPMLRAAGLPRVQWGPVSRFVAQLYDIFVAEDAELIEINPLAVTRANEIVAVDAKVELDDSAEFRHPARAAMRSKSLRPTTTTELERKAAAAGITLVELDGNVALITSGAGLGMAVVDELSDCGIRPANFIDAPGGAGLELKIDFVFELARQDRVKAIAVYILQTAQPLSRAIGSLLATLEKKPLSKPVVVGLVAAAAGERGMSVAEAKAKLAGHGLVAVSELGDLVEELKKVVSLS